MTPKSTVHVIQGMQKDTSKSKLGKEFAFDAKNIRITAREGNTLLTITNEKGTKDCHGLFGYYLGHCVLNNQLVLFTTIPDAEINKDLIFLYDSDFRQTSLYNGNLNFNLNNPLETLGVYENEDIQKVYWVDGLNQPRVINIAAKNEIKEKWNDSSFDFIPELQLNETVDVEAISNSSMFAPGVIQYAFSYYNKYGQESNIFNTTPLCYLAFNNRGASPEEIIKDRAFKITVSNLDTNFEYVRIYSIHRTSLDAVPTVKRVIDLPITIPEEYTDIRESVTSYYIGNTNKAYLKRKDVIAEGATNVDRNHGKLISKIFTDITSENLNNGVINTYRCPNTIRPTDAFDIIIGRYENGEFTEIEKVIKIEDLRYIQYIEIINTINEKGVSSYEIKSIAKNDQSEPLPFIVEYTIENSTIPNISYIDNGTLGETIDPTQLLYIGGEDIIAGTITAKDNTLFLGNIELKNLSVPTSIKNNLSNVTILPLRRTEDIPIKDDLFYSSEYPLSNITSYYRAGEHYRLGIQFQYKNGRWSEPIFIADKTQGLQMRPTIIDNTIYLPSFDFEIPSEIREELYSLGFKKMRGLVVFPEPHDRKVLLQGMLCPTVFNKKDREENSPYAQSSWFLRPFLFDTTKDGLPISIDDSYFIKNNGNSLEYEDNIEDINRGAFLEFRHGSSIIGSFKNDLSIDGNRGSEIQNGYEYKIDQSILTLHSPEIELEDFNINSNNNVQVRIVGIINFTSNYGDIDIQTKTPTRNINALGFTHRKISNILSGDTSLVSGLFYNDSSSESKETDRFYMTYLWHRSGSLNDDTSSSDNQSGILLKKKISNIKFSKYNTWINYNKVWKSFGGNSIKSLANGISNIEKFNSDQVSLLKLNSGTGECFNYYGNIDSLLPSEEKFPIFYGNDWANKELLEDDNKGTEPVRMKYKSSPHLVFKLNNAVSGHEIVLPNINGLNSVDGNQITNTKNPLPEYLGEEIKYRTYVSTGTSGSPTNMIDGDLWLKEELVYYGYYPDIPPEEVEVGGGRFYITRLLKYTNGKWEDYIQQANKDKNIKAYYLENDFEASLYYFNGRQAVATDDSASNNYIYAFVWKFEKKVNITPPEVETITVSQDSIEKINLNYPYLYLAELYVDSNLMKSAFGGNSESAIKNNLWIPASKSIPINEGTLTYEYGDTRYQRYDCLKTYAFTPEDENQVIEIASFMCETRVNMLGRYDKNIGNLSNLNADPTNFNLFNPVYSQKDNFFNYRILDSDIYKLDKFTNTITWSKEKYAGEDVDTWTNITMASTLDLDGTKGKVNKLLTFKDQIFAFQDKGISNILFNSRVQIPVSDGVPIEISNGMKVEGSRYISDNIGCQNKKSIVTTPSGVYFLDSESNGIYLLADGLTNLSTNKGFDIWTKEVSKDPSFKSFYDKNEKDVYFTTEKYCLGYSEKLGQFTSFYDYNDVETMFNVGTGFYSIKANSVGYQSIYQHSIGKYNEFYGEIKPYHLTIISNDDPQVDKVFTNLDYRADFFDSNNNYLENESFDTLEVWNEYQEGKETLKYSKFRPSNLKKKFRMWGANIPRDKKNKLDRMRNPWLYIKLSKEKPGTSKMELHDIVVKYFE